MHVYMYLRTLPEAAHKFPALWALFPSYSFVIIARENTLQDVGCY